MTLFDENVVGGKEWCGLHKRILRASGFLVSSWSSKVGNDCLQLNLNLDFLPGYLLNPAPALPSSHLSTPQSRQEHSLLLGSTYQLENMDEQRPLLPSDVHQHPPGFASSSYRTAQHQVKRYLTSK